MFEWNWASIELVTTAMVRLLLNKPPSSYVMSQQQSKASWTYMWKKDLFSLCVLFLSSQLMHFGFDLFYLMKLTCERGGEQTRCCRLSLQHLSPTTLVSSVYRQRCILFLVLKNESHVVEQLSSWRQMSFTSWINQDEKVGETASASMRLTMTRVFCCVVTWTRPTAHHKHFRI